MNRFQVTVEEEPKDTGSWKQYSPYGHVHASVPVCTEHACRTYSPRQTQYTISIIISMIDTSLVGAILVDMLTSGAEPQFSALAQLKKGIVRYIID